MATTGDSDRKKKKKKSHECAGAAEATGVTRSPPLYACALLSPPTAVSGTVSVGFQTAPLAGALGNSRMRLTLRGFARCQQLALGGVIPPVGTKHARAEVRTREGRVCTASMRPAERDGGSAGSSERRRSAVFVCGTDGRPGGARRRRGRWRRPPWSRSCPAWKQS